MAGEFFVDTSALYPLVVTAHPDHPAIAATMRMFLNERNRVVTTNLVVAESHALLRCRAGHRAALTFARTVGEPPNLVVHSGADIEGRAVRDWLERFGDHDFSFTDAVSFAVMAERNIQDALTLDHHFAIAGFRITGGRR